MVTTPDAVNDRLFFAIRRLRDLGELNNGDLAGAQYRDKQQLIQEFFFHLVGAVEFLAQVVNTSRVLGIDVEEVSVPTVCRSLPEGDSTRELLEQLHPKTRGEPPPIDPYSDEGSHFRILVLRNRVCHHNHNPFHYRLVFGVGPNERSTHLSIDPRYPELGASEKTAIDELNHFWRSVNDKCQQVIRQL